MRLGHFGYGHIEPTVVDGQHVDPGEMIGWTTEGEWHVHLSEWFFPDGDRDRMVAVNPLSRDGKLAPYVDTAPPVIHDIAFFTPASPAWRKPQGVAFFPRSGARLDPTLLTGVVDVRARIEDPQTFVGWFRDYPVLETSHHPTRVHLSVVRASDGKSIVDRDVFQAEVTLGSDARHVGVSPIPFSNHYAPGTRQNLRAATTLKLGRAGRGELWFRLFARPRISYWDTTRLANGTYSLTVGAWDVVGNRTQESVDVTIVN